MIKKKADNTATKYCGTRMTLQRRIVMEEMQTPNRHLTADEVYARVRRRIPHISLGTVYRNLELLAQTGKIKKLSIGSGPKQYDGGVHRHYHVRCVECDMVSDVSSDAFGDLDTIAAVGGGGFDIIDHELEFTGLCSKCKSHKSL
jgi:Fur family transcriptional regulator, ferric uptake regulator